MEVEELEEENDEILADNELVLRPKKMSGKKRSREKESGSEQNESDSEQSAVPQNFPPKDDKIPDATHLGPEHINNRTRSKVCEAKAVQTEPTTVSVGTNTANRVH